MSFFVWISIVIMAAVSILLVFALCRIASKTDEEDERMFDEFMKKNKR